MLRPYTEVGTLIRMAHVIPLEVLYPGHFATTGYPIALASYPNLTERILLSSRYSFHTLYGNAWVGFSPFQRSVDLKTKLCTISTHAYNQAFKGDAKRVGVNDWRTRLRPSMQARLNANRYVLKKHFMNYE
jgi:hypothetical protein